MSGTIGILLPPRADLASLRRARELALLISDCAEPGQRPFRVAIGLPETDDRIWREREQFLRGESDQIVVRHLQWEAVPVDQARRMFGRALDELNLADIEILQFPRDWGWNFQDCGGLVIFADPGLGAPVTLKPSAFYCRDLAVRFVPEAFADSIKDPYWDRQTEAFQQWRRAQVWTSDEDSVADIVSYAGVRRERVTLLPSLVDVIETDRRSQGVRDESSLLWLMEVSALHDLESAASGLQLYLDEGGQLKPHVAGEGVSQLDPAAESKVVSKLPRHLGDFLATLPRRPITSVRELTRRLDRSGVLWSSLIAGGGGEAALLAASHGAAFVGADFGVNRRASAATSGRSILYGLGDPTAIADALHRAERETLKARRGTSKPLASRAERIARLQQALRDLVGTSSAP